MNRRYWSLGEDRAHSVYRYTDQIYKVVQWYRVPNHFGPGPRERQEHHEKKLDSSLSRARRVILEKSLCNSWDWFCTLTIAGDKFDRKDLAAWHSSFVQWIRDLRKKGYSIHYLVVPEQHKDGSWHAHGLFSGLPDSELISFKEMHKNGYRSPSGRLLPLKLRKSEYYNWPAYQKKFGNCSLGRINNPVATGFYISKYITKEHSRMVQTVGLHSYYCSQGLAGATKHIDFYGRSWDVDRLLVNRYDFCATGMTHLRDNVDWTFCLDGYWSQLEPLVFDSNFDGEKSEPELEADSYYEFEQLVLDMKK